MTEQEYYEAVQSRIILFGREYALLWMELHPKHELVNEGK